MSVIDLEKIKKSKIKPYEIIKSNKKGTKKIYDFLKMSDMVNKALGFDQRKAGKIFHPDTGDFYDWCNLKGYGQKDPEGKDRGSSQIWFAEYQKDIKKGEWKDTPYLDFWHWQLDHCMDDDFRNDSYSTVYVGLDRDVIGKPKDWQMEIQKVWNQMFEHISDNGYINIWVSW